MGILDGPSALIAGGLAVGASRPRLLCRILDVLLEPVSNSNVCLARISALMMCMEQGRDITSW